MIFMERLPNVVLMIESSRASGRALLRGIANYAHQWGPWAFSWETGGLERALPTLCDSATSGVILRDLDKVQTVLAHGVPTVVIGHHRKEIPDVVNVTTDSESIGHLAAEHLMKCGFRRFAFCGYATTNSTHAAWSRTRRLAFQARLGKSNYRSAYVLEMPIDSGDWLKRQGETIDWIRALIKPVGLFACNDDCAQRMMATCRLAGIAVPDEIGIIGADNDEFLCGLTDPPMSSVALNFQQAGYEAAKALDQLMRGEPPAAKQIVTKAMHVVARRSTDFAAAENTNVHKALKFIRDCARRPITVNEVASVSGLSRRGLEKAFQIHLGRTILHEIRRVRVDQIARLLIETNLQIEEISESLGFPDFQHVSRYFRAVKKTSPSAFRCMHRQLKT